MLTTLALVAALSTSPGAYFCACASWCMTSTGEKLVSKSGLYPASSEKDAGSMCLAETVTQCLQGEDGILIRPALVQCF